MIILDIIVRSGFWELCTHHYAKNVVALSGQPPERQRQPI